MRLRMSFESKGMVEGINGSYIYYVSMEHTLDFVFTNGTFTDNAPRMSVVSLYAVRPLDKLKRKRGEKRENTAKATWPVLRHNISNKNDRGLEHHSTESAVTGSRCTATCLLDWR